MTNKVAITTTQNIVPVQAEFDVNGVCLGLVGPGGAFFSPPISTDNITNSTITSSTINSTPIGAITPSTGAFTSLSSTQDASIHGLTVGLGGGSVSSNTAFGNGALTSNTTGSENSALGLQSLLSNTTGSYNSAFGRTALYSNTTGSTNSAFGDGALQINTTGSNNTATGYGALLNNTTASSNTAVGYQAGYSNTTGYSNLYAGDQAGYTNSTGTDNTILGYNAGYYSTASGNVFIGSSAGYDVTTGTGNTFVGGNSVGYASGIYVTTGSNNTILGGYNGNQGGLDIRTANNYIVLSDGSGNPRGVFDNNGYLYVGTTTAYNVDSNGFILGPGSGTTLVTKHITGTTDGAYYSLFTYGGSIIGSVSQAGTTGVLYNVTSDQRLKENIVDASDASADIDAIQVRSFDFISDKSTVKYGFIAQELVTVAPYAVHQPSNPDEMMSVDYSKLVPMMLKEIQSLRKRIATLEGK